MMDSIYLVLYNTDDDPPEAFEEYDEAQTFIQESNKIAEDSGLNAPYFSIPVEVHFNPSGTKWSHE